MGTEIACNQSRFLVVRSLFLKSDYTQSVCPSVYLLECCREEASRRDKTTINRKISEARRKNMFCDRTRTTRRDKKSIMSWVESFLFMMMLLGIRWLIRETIFWASTFCISPFFYIPQFPLRFLWYRVSGSCVGDARSQIIGFGLIVLVWPLFVVVSIEFRWSGCKSDVISMPRCHFSRMTR